MRLWFVLLSMVCIATSCSSFKKEKSEATAAVELGDLPFQNLQAIRVMVEIVSNKVDRELLKNGVIGELKKIGHVWTPSDTSVDQLLKAEEKPFALLILKLEEISNSNHSEIFPVMHLSLKMYEKTELLINRKNWMSNVWEQNAYIEVLPDQSTLNEKTFQEIQTALNIFSENYSKSNTKTSKPSFYIGK